MNRVLKSLVNQLSKKSTLFILILVVCVYLTLSLSGLTPGFGGQVMQVLGLGPPDPLWEDIPPDKIHIRLKAKDIRITHYEIEVPVDGEILKVSCSETPSVYRSERTRQVLLLHGSSSTRDSWERLGTMQLLSTWGHRCVAIDIPGYGRSTSTIIRQESRHGFLSSLMDKLQLSSAVIVSPSVSGFFSLPFCVSSPNRCDALVGVSVSVPLGLGQSDMANFTVPGLAIYGKKDTFGEKMAGLLAHAPRIFVRAIPDADKQPHLEKPDDFHRLLYNFLLKLSR